MATHPQVSDHKIDDENKDIKMIDAPPYASAPASTSTSSASSVSAATLMIRKDVEEKKTIGEVVLDPDAEHQATLEGVRRFHEERIAQKRQ